MTSPLSKKRIGLYDSGLGGLSLLKDLVTFFPENDYFYLADNLHLPYGEKSKKELTHNLTSINNWMTSLPLDALVVACNTASTFYVHQEKYNQTFLLNTISSTLKKVKEKISSYPKQNRIGILATTYTVKSQTYLQHLNSINPQFEIFQEAAPSLSHYIEKGDLSNPHFKNDLKNYLQPLLEKNIDIFIPACTHYLFILDSIKEILPPHVTIIDPRKTLRNELASLLHLSLQKKNSSTLISSKNSPSIQVYYTLKDPLFQKLTQKILLPFKAIFSFKELSKTSKISNLQSL